MSVPTSGPRACCCNKFNPFFLSDYKGCEKKLALAMDLNDTAQLLEDTVFLPEGWDFIHIFHMILCEFGTYVLGR